MILTIVALTFVFETGATCVGSSCVEFRSTGSNLLQTKIDKDKHEEGGHTGQHENLSGWTPPAVVPRLYAENLKCTKHVDLRKMGAWRYGQNGTSPSLGAALQLEIKDLAKCALLVHQTGGSWGCISGIFHFAKKGADGLSGCGCAITDGCASREASNDWDVYILTAYSSLGDGLGQGVDENRRTWFPKAPTNGPKIWHKKTHLFKVSETSDCGDGYEPILNVDACRDAGNALNIEPWPLSWLPMFNGFCHWAWPFIPPGNWKHGDIEMESPVFDPGCLVAPGKNRGKKISYFDVDALLFNVFDNGGQKHDDNMTFVKHRICKKAAPSYTATGMRAVGNGLYTAKPNSRHGGKQIFTNGQVKACFDGSSWKLTNQQLDNDDYCNHDFDYKAPGQDLTGTGWTYCAQAGCQFTQAQRRS